MRPKYFIFCCQFHATQHIFIAVFIILIKKPCNKAAGFKPVQAHCRIKNSRQPWYTANKVISRKCYACTAKGIRCINQVQGCGKYQVCCPDYEVRFLYYKQARI